MKRTAVPREPAPAEALGAMFWSIVVVVVVVVSSVVRVTSGLV
jgi:hypothetical protein